MDILDNILKWAGKSGKSENPGQRLFPADKRPTNDNLTETKQARKAEAQRQLSPVANLISMLAPGGLATQLATYSPEAEAAIRWQGSPNFIKGTKFDMSKLGTGEGAQVWGKGHYVAESPAVANTYRETLSAKRLSEKMLEGFDSSDPISEQMLRGTEFTSPEKKFLAALNKDQLLGFDYPVQAVRVAGNPKSRQGYDISQELQQATERLGHLYKVDVPDEAIARMLNVSASFGEQAPQVKNLVSKAAKLKEKQTGTLHAFPDDYNAREIVRDLGEARLNEVGIPGLTYLDQGSRGTGGTVNNVLFNDDLARILEKNGKPTGEKPWMPGEYDYKSPTEAEKDIAVQNILKFIKDNGVTL